MVMPQYILIQMILDEIANSLKMTLIDKALRQKLIEEGIAQLKKYNSNDNIKKTIRYY